MNCKLLHSIGMNKFTPLWLKMWCLNMMMKETHKMIASLPSEQRDKIDSATGKIRA